MRRRTRLDQSTLLALVDAAYSAAEEHHRWEPLLASIADAVAGTAACLLVHNLVEAGNAFMAAGFDPEATRLYNEYYHRVDAWALAPAAMSLSRPMQATADQVYIPRSALQRTEFYPFVKRYGVSRMIHTTLRVDERGISGLSVYRGERDEPFGDREAAFLAALAPHLDRAVHLHDRLAQAAHERNAALDGLDNVPIGILLVTGEGHVVHANRSADRTLARRDGLFLDRSLLNAGAPHITAQIRQYCAECANTTLGRGMNAGGTISVPRPSGARNLQLLVSPVRRTQALGFSDDCVAAMVFVTDPDQETPPNARVLQMLYGLTPAESRVAMLLACGKSVREIGDACQYTVQTVQWYSKQILSKTGCRSRAALVRELSGPLISLTIASPE
jgi:DNA-binding NarL/FixJ family response regulator